MPRTSVPLDPFAMVIPSPPLPETTLRAAAVVPPMSVSLLPSTRMPWNPFPKAALPEASVPTRLPWIVVCATREREIPDWLPEMTLPSPGPVPPRRLPVEICPANIKVTVNPDMLFRSSRLPWITLSFEERIATPLPFPAARFPMIRFSPTTEFRPTLTPSCPLPSSMVPVTSVPR